MKKTFDKEYLVNELDLPDSAISDEITGNGRWSIHRTIVFEDGGKHWRTDYSEGATESQDEAPWEYEDEVECEEVVQKEVSTLQWVAAE